MSIFPLPVFEADADPERRDVRTDEEIYAALRPPTSIVVRFGSMRMVGEFAYEGRDKPGCGSKLVVRTPRGTEVAEMLTTTCSNSGCGKSVSRSEMLAYIEQSGGRDFPFHDHGRVLRLATAADLAQWEAIQATKRDLVGRAREIAARLREEGDPPLKIVDAEPILGGEMLTFFYLSEERIDFRSLVQELAAEFGTRIEMRHIGARDEARLVADYERCGQHCCCRGFLKVLKPVSMKSAKTQKATLDPLKISGRCGRLMCCLRYEDQTYADLQKRLPKVKSRVGTSEGPGTVIDTRILVQLVLVRLDADGREVALPVEELLDPDTCPRPDRNPAPAPPTLQRPARSAATASPPASAAPPASPAPSTPRRPPQPPGQAARQGPRQAPSSHAGGPRGDRGPTPKRTDQPERAGYAPTRRDSSKRRRRRKPELDDRSQEARAQGDRKPGESPQGEPDSKESQPKRKRRRRGRRQRGGEGGGGGGGGGGGDRE